MALWTKAPVTIVQGYEARHPGSGVTITPLVIWASWAVESLHYLDDIDRAHTGTGKPVFGHSPYIVDIANVRWATGTAITSLDLCAAALGRAYCGNAGSREMDLRNFDPSNKKTKAKNEANRKVLHPSALPWIDSVLADSRYVEIHGARNSFTHSWLNRTMSVGGQSRTMFTILATKKSLNARELVEKARDLATEQINAFLTIFDHL